MAYADFEYYQSEFCGGTVLEEDFPQMAARASDYIDYITTGRAVGAADNPQVKKCCCALAEIVLLLEEAKASAASEGEVKSETVGSWSRTYQTTGEMEKECRERLFTTAQRYLASTGLLYRGGGCK